MEVACRQLDSCIHLRSQKKLDYTCEFKNYPTDKMKAEKGNLYYFNILIHMLKSI